MALKFSRFDAVASRRRAPVVRHVREIILQKRVLLGAEIKMSRSPFRPPSRVWRWEMRRDARSCTRARHARLAASQVVAKHVALWGPQNIRQVAIFGKPFSQIARVPRISPDIPYISALVLFFVFGCVRCSFVLFAWVVECLGAFSNMCAPNRIRLFRMVHARGAPQVRGDAMRRRRVARIAMSTTMHKVFLSRVCRQMRRRRPL
jgi:hypothetical protein